MGVLSVGAVVSLASAAEASADSASTVVSSPSAVSSEAADGHARPGRAPRATKSNPGAASAVGARSRPASGVSGARAAAVVAGRVVGVGRNTPAGPARPSAKDVAAQVNLAPAIAEVRAPRLVLATPTEPDLVVTQIVGRARAAARVAAASPPFGSDIPSLAGVLAQSAPLSTELGPVVRLLGGFLSVFGLNTPVAPTDPFGALAWSVWRFVGKSLGFVPTEPLASLANPDPISGVISGRWASSNAAGLPLTYSAPGLSTGGANVSVALATGEFTYTPTTAQRQVATAMTTDVFTITASNGLAATRETIIVTVDPGTPVPAESIAGDRDPATGAVTGIAVFSDTAGRALDYRSAATSSGGGSVAVDALSGAWTYLPTRAQREAATDSSTDSFVVTADNGVRTATQTVVVAVEPAPTVESAALISGESRNFAYSSLTPETADAVVALILESNRGATHPKVNDPVASVENQLSRIASGNSYHLLVFERRGVAQAAFIQGQMPKSGYKPGEHDRIIVKFSELLSVVDQPERYGFATVVPIIADGVGAGARQEIYETIVEVALGLAQQGKTLPQASAGLRPCQLLMLLDPQHPDIAMLQSLGFVNHGNYPEFYSADRVLLSYLLV